MIKREKLKQAIDAIAGRDPEIGYSLNEMLGAGLIDAPAPDQPTTLGPDPYFLFQNQKTVVRKYRFFTEDVAALEERLLIKYGELVRTHELQHHGDSLNYRDAAVKVRDAGLRLLVAHEIDLLLDRLGKASPVAAPVTDERPPAETGADNEGADPLERDRSLASFLTRIKDDEVSARLPGDENDPSVLQQGVVDQDTPAYFIRFPYCLDSLMRVANVNLEFFSIRFLLNCLVDHTDRNLFACVVNRRIVGLVFLDFKRDFFYRALSIKFISTARGRRERDDHLSIPPIKGAGSVLVAGVWMLWKTMRPKVHELYLDSELEAQRFYESLGFESRRPHEYVLKKPQGYLLRNLLVMANNCRELPPPLLRELRGLIIGQVKALGRRGGDQQQDVRRRADLDLIAQCLRSRPHKELALAAADGLVRYRRRIPEAENLIKLAWEYGLVRTASDARYLQKQALVVFDERFSHHLENVFHLDSPKRAQVIQEVLRHASVLGRWVDMPARMASVNELTWVHTREHVERIARTAGRRLTSLDLDTQTSERSYEVARLAAGGVFNLMDEIWSRRIKRGFAFVRPPGHHAEPDRPMGFCLFNNVALAARYLQKTYSVQRIMIVDIDMHHGNGTQAAFYDTDRVLFVSSHRFPGFPGTGKMGEVGRGAGEGFNVNIPLAKGQGDRDYARIIHFIVDPLARQYQPEIMLISCGFDLYIHDRMSEMTVTPEGYGLMTYLLMNIAEDVCQGRIGFVLEGGYSLKGIRECGLKVMQELCGASNFDRQRVNKLMDASPLRQSGLQKVMEVQAKYWTL